MSAAESSRSVEIERKYDADAGTPVPDWSGVAGIASVGEPELRELDARYLDTDDLILARSGYALRRRSGGPDAGWHVKGPIVDGGRVELHWPLGADDEGVPADVLAVLGEALAPAPTARSLRPLARIRNTRTAYALRDQSGGLVAEFVDDLVTTVDVRTGVERSWREWELELGPSAPTDADSFFAAAERAVRTAGGREAASASKLARALGR